MRRLDTSCFFYANLRPPECEFTMPNLKLRAKCFKIFDSQKVSCAEKLRNLVKYFFYECYCNTYTFREEVLEISLDKK